MLTSQATKGGFFIPMYQREAMWVEFNSNSKFAIRTYVGDVNAVSGESVLETEKAYEARAARLRAKKTIQDYVVTPDQLWLNNIASEDGLVRLFVAMSLGTGYTVEAQITGENVVRGVPIQVIPAKLPALGSEPPSCHPRLKPEFSGTTMFPRIEVQIYIASSLLMPSTKTANRLPRRRRRRRKSTRTLATRWLCSTRTRASARPSGRPRYLRKRPELARRGSSMGFELSGCEEWLPQESCVLVCVVDSSVARLWAAGG